MKRAIFRLNLPLNEHKPSCVPTVAAATVPVFKASTEAEIVAIYVAFGLVALAKYLE